MPRVIIIPNSQIESVCQDVVVFANSCQTDFQFYIIPKTTTDSPLNEDSSEVIDILKYLENIKQLYNYEPDDFILAFYNGVLKATNYNPSLTNLFCAGSRYDEDQPCTGVISLKYLGWNILEERYNYELQKHSILHLIICALIGSYTHLKAHNDVGCLLDRNLNLTSFNLKLERGYYLCSNHEYGCGELIKKEKYGNAILRLCYSFKNSFSIYQNKILETNIQVQPISRKKYKLEFINWFTIISTICALVVLLIGNNLLGWHKTNDRFVDKKVSTIEMREKKDTILSILELPYLEAIPIIDNGLFIKYYYNNFVLGGINIDTIKINARSKSGESLSLSRSNNEIRIEISKEPFVEFEYKGTNFSIELKKRNFTFSCLLRKEIKPTLLLKKYSDY